MIAHLRLDGRPPEGDTELRLKRCPFCRGSKRVVRLVVYEADGINRFSDKYAVQCRYTGEKYGCGAEGQQNKSLKAAVAAWNLRRLKN